MKLQNKEGNKKNMKRRMRAFICVIIMLMSSVLYNYNGNIQASTLKYVKLNTNYIMKDKYGFTKLTVNGSSKSLKNGVKSLKFKLKYEGKYVVKTVNKKGQKKTTIFYVDGTKPQIKCVTVGNKVIVTVKDDRKLSQVLLNGKKVKSKFTIATAGNYKIEAKDKAGNKKFRVVKVKEAKVQETEIPVVTEVPETKVPAVTSNPSIVPDVKDECDHLWNDGVIVKKATCTEKGEIRYECKICGVVSTKDISIIEHVYQKDIDSRVVKEKATCQHGTIYYTRCKYCGQAGTDTWTNSDILEHDHKLKNDVLASSPTCQSPANYYYSCSMCGKAVKDSQTYQGTILDSSNHVSQETHVHAATCIAEGYSIHYCTYCKKEYGERFDYIEMLGHIYDEEKGSHKTVISKPTCTSEGTYQLDCAREKCNETSNKIYKTPALNHDYSVEKTISEATAAEDRTYTLNCSACGTGDGQTHTDIGTHTDHRPPAVTLAVTFSTGEVTPITTYYLGYETMPTGIQYNNPNAIPRAYINIQVHDVESGIKSVSWQLLGFSDPTYINDWNERIALKAWEQVEGIGMYSKKCYGTNDPVFVASEAYLSLDPKVLGSNEQFVVVRVEDVAGNISILRSWDLCAY